MPLPNGEETLKEFMDRVLSWDWDGMDRFMKCPTDFVNLILLAGMGQIWASLYYGSDRVGTAAPKPSEADEWSDEERDTWKKAHPRCHIDDAWPADLTT